MTDPTSRQRGRPIQTGLQVSFKININIWSLAPDGARHQDRQTDWLSVVKWLWLWLDSGSKGTRAWRRSLTKFRCYIGTTGSVLLYESGEKMFSPTEGTLRNCHWFSVRTTRNQRRGKTILKGIWTHNSLEPNPPKRLSLCSTKCRRHCGFPRFLDEDRLKNGNLLEH
jgi:hypothetical protein